MQTPAFPIIYNRAQAVASLGGRPLVWVESSADVDAAVGAGIPATVSTIGLATIEANLRELWTISAVVVVCCAGDLVGRAAAGEVAQAARPLLSPDRRLRMALLPTDHTVQTILKDKGPDALRDALQHAKDLGGYQTPASQKNAPTKPPAPRQPIVRKNSNSMHSTSPGSVRLSLGLTEETGLSLREALILAKVAGHPETADPEQIAAHDGLSARVRTALGELFDKIGQLDTTSISAHPMVVEALAVCRGAGIRLAV